jgi:hypothetical protein
MKTSTFLKTYYGTHFLVPTSNEDVDSSYTSVVLKHFNPFKNPYQKLYILANDDTAEHTSAKKIWW